MLDNGSLYDLPSSTSTYSIETLTDGMKPHYHKQLRDSFDRYNSMNSFNGDSIDNNNNNNNNDRYYSLEDEDEDDSEYEYYEQSRANRRPCNWLQSITVDIFKLIFLSEEFIEDEFDDFDTRGNGGNGSMNSQRDGGITDSILSRLELRILNDATDTIVSTSLQDLIQRNSKNLIYFSNNYH
eukprot:UN01798